MRGYQKDPLASAQGGSRFDQGTHLPLILARVQQTDIGTRCFRETVFPVLAPAIGR
jgi:hypothetical protein